MQCKLCNSENCRIVYTRPQADSHGENIRFHPTTSDFGIFFRLVKCGDCDMVFSDFETEKSSLSRLYSDSVDETYMLQEKERDIPYERVLNDLNRFVGKKEPVLLDVGCSYGLFLKLARQKGYHVYGVETSRDACRHCKETLGLDVFCGELKEANFGSNNFDVVVALEVLEHVYEPRELLLEMKKVLKPGGILYLATPNHKSLSARLLSHKWWSYRKMHLHYFSKKTLCAFLKNNGFEVILCKPYLKTFKIGYILKQLSEYNAALFKFLNSINKVFRLSKRLLTASFGDMALIARKRI